MTTNTPNVRKIDCKIITVLVVGIATILAICYTVGAIMVTIGNVVDSNSDATVYNACKCVILRTIDIVMMFVWSAALAFALGAFIKCCKYLKNFEFKGVCAVVDKRENVEMV